MPEAILYRTEFERNLLDLAGRRGSEQVRLAIRTTAVEAAARCFQGRGYLANDLIDTARMVESYLIEEVAPPALVDTA